MSACRQLRSRICNYQHNVHPRSVNASVCTCVCVCVYVCVITYALSSIVISIPTIRPRPTRSYGSGVGVFAAACPHLHPTAAGDRAILHPPVAPDEGVPHSRVAYSYILATPMPISKIALGTSQYRANVTHRVNIDASPALCVFMM